MKTNTQLIANSASWKNPWKRKKIEQISTMLTGSLQAMGKVGLKLNVAKENLNKVMSLLPSLKAPTISSLSSDKWFAVESIVDAKIMRDLIPKLLEAGAQGIIEYPLNKVI
jgi:ATP phosphoribosyltransferase